MDWRHLFELLTAGRATYTELKNVCVWTKTNAGMGSCTGLSTSWFRCSSPEKLLHINTVELGRPPRPLPTNVWSYAGANSFGRDRRADLRLHPTAARRMVAGDDRRRVEARRHRARPVLGSGTTLIAAEQVGRIAWAVSWSRGYVDAAVRRWQARIRKRRLCSRPPCYCRPPAPPNGRTRGLSETAILSGCTDHVSCRMTPLM